MAKNKYKDSNYKKEGCMKTPLSVSVKIGDKEILSNISKSQGISVGKLSGLIIESWIKSLEKEGKLEDLDALRIRDLFDLEILI